MSPEGADVPMIHCPECNRQVSDQAASCPGCGHPLKATPRDTGAARSGGGIAPVVGKVAGVYLVVIGVVAVVLFGGFFLLMAKLAG